MGDDTPHKKYLQFANATIQLSNRKVLEIGGCSPPNLVKAYTPSEWTCVNLDSHAVSKFNETAQELGLINYLARNEDIVKLEHQKAYDLIYSVNAFEHIHDLDEAFEKMYRVLNPGGYLFALFGPIWSSDVGHHLSIPSDKGDLHFFDGILEPWEHLVSTPEKIQSKLEALYGHSTAQRAVEYIYTYPDLNRLYEYEYLKIMKNSGFSPVLILKKRNGSPPKGLGATSTRELLMILKKGRVPMWEQASCFMKFSLEFVRRKTFVRNSE